MSIRPDQIPQEAVRLLKALAEARLTLDRYARPWDFNLPVPAGYLEMRFGSDAADAVAEIDALLSQKESTP